MFQLRVLGFFLLIGLPSISMAENWNSIFEGSLNTLIFQVSKDALEINGEISTANIGVSEKSTNYANTGLFGLLVHASVLSVQRNMQSEKIISESKEFGKLLTESFPRINRDDFLNSTINKMPEFTKTGISINPSDKEKNNRFNVVEFKYSVMKDYKGILLDISIGSVEDKNSQFKFNIYRNSVSPYIGKDGKVELSNNIFEDMTFLMQEALRIYVKRKERKLINSTDKNITFKSMIGDDRRYERGVLIAETCDRHLFVNLADVWVAAPKIEPDQTSVLCNTGFSTLQIQ